MIVFRNYTIGAITPLYKINFDILLSYTVLPKVFVYCLMSTHPLLKQLQLFWEVFYQVVVRTKL